MIQRLRSLSSGKVVALWAVLLAAPLAAESPRPLAEIVGTPLASPWSLSDVTAKPLNSYPGGCLWDGFCGEPLFFCHPCYRSDCTDQGQCGSGVSGTCQACLGSHGGSVSRCVSATGCQSCQTKVRVGNLAPVVNAQPPAAVRKGLSPRSLQPLAGNAPARRPGQLSPADLVMLSAPPSAQWVEGIPEGHLASQEPAPPATVGNPFIQHDVLKPQPSRPVVPGPLSPSGSAWFQDSHVRPATAVSDLMTSAVRVDAANTIAEPDGADAHESTAPLVPAAPTAPTESSRTPQGSRTKVNQGSFQRLRSQLDELAR